MRGCGAALLVTILLFSLLSLTAFAITFGVLLVAFVVVCRLRENRRRATRAERLEARKAGGPAPVEHRSAEGIAEADDRAALRRSERLNERVLCASLFLLAAVALPAFFFIDRADFLLVVLLSVPLLAVVASAYGGARATRTLEERAAAARARMASPPPDDDGRRRAPGRLSLNRGTRLRKSVKSWTGRW